MARLEGFSTERAAQDYGFSRQAAANRFREQEVEAANQVLEEQLQKIQDEASKKPKKKGGFLENLVKTVAFSALGPLGAGLQLIDAIASGAKTDKEYKESIADIKKLAELNPELMKRFEGTPLESILANTIGQGAAQGAQYLQGARGAAKTGALLDVALSALGLGQSFAATKGAKAIANTQVPFVTDVKPPMILKSSGNKSNFLSNLGATVGDIGEGALQAFGGQKGGQVLADTAKLATKPINTEIQSPQFLQPLVGQTMNFNPYSLLRTGKSPLIDYLIGQPGDISFSEIDAPRRRIR